jgi:hypothetical protein
LSSSHGPATQAERLERLRAHLQGRPAIAAQVHRKRPGRGAHLLLGVMLRGAARLEAGLELTELEQRLVGILRAVLTEDEIAQFGRVYAEEVAAGHAQQVLPDAVNGRDLAAGYTEADLDKDVAALSEEIRSETNLNVVDADGGPCPAMRAGRPAGAATVAKASRRSPLRSGLPSVETKKLSQRGRGKTELAPLCRSAAP